MLFPILPPSESHVRFHGGHVFMGRHGMAVVWEAINRHHCYEIVSSYMPLISTSRYPSIHPSISLSVCSRYDMYALIDGQMGTDLDGIYRGLPHGPVLCHGLRPLPFFPFLLVARGRWLAHTHTCPTSWLAPRVVAFLAKLPFRLLFPATGFTSQGIAVLSASRSAKRRFSQSSPGVHEANVTQLRTPHHCQQ